MSARRLVDALLVGWVIGLLPGWASAAEQCHLHAPADYPSFSRQPLVIPALGNQARCESVNLERFGRQGRCHCISSDTPGGGVRPLDPLAVPGQRDVLG